MKSIAVVVPVYNMEKYLKSCIQSLCNQNYPYLEIILVDDGSTDSSGEICDEYAKKDKRIKVIHLEEIGALKARQIGVMNSNSDYITFVDSDDWIEDDTYLKLSDILEKDIDMVMFEKIIEKGNKGRTFSKSNYAYGLYDKKDIQEKIYPTMIWDSSKERVGITQSLCDKIIKREFLVRSYELTNNLENIHNAADALILLPLLQWINSLYISKEALYHYRMTHNQIPSYICNDDFFEKLFIWYSHIIKHITDIPDSRKQIESVYLYMANRRKEFYGNSSIRDEYMFPFKFVSVDSRIVLWGAGRIGKMYYEQIKRTDFCQVVAWVDTNYEQYQELGVESVDILEDTDMYDYIVIAIYSEQVKKEIITWLEGKDIPIKRVIWKII